MYAHLSSPLNFIVSRNLNDHFLKLYFYISEISLHTITFYKLFILCKLFSFYILTDQLYQAIVFVSRFSSFHWIRTVRIKHIRFRCSTHFSFQLLKFQSIFFHFFPFILIENFSAKQTAFTLECNAWVFFLI